MIDLLRHYLRNQRFRVAILGVLLLLATVLLSISPQIVRAALDAAVAGAAAARLTILALAFVVAAMLQQGITVLATYLSVQIGWKATNELRTDLLRHALGLDMRFHNAHTPGEMIERVDGDVTLLSN